MSLPEPVTRKEQYLNSIATGNNSGKPGYPVTREEMYLDAIAEGGSEPTGEGYRTIEGNPLEFDSPSPQILGSVICDIEASQDLHGYDKPWAGGAGKNKLPMTVDGIKALNTSGTWSGNVYTYRDVICTILTDDANNVTGIKFDGTASANMWFRIAPTTFDLESNTIINGCPANGSYGTYCIRLLASDDTDVLGTDDGSGITISNPYENVNMYILIGNGYTANNIIFYPMVRLATETDPTFEPYSNICPITGTDTIDIDVTGGESYTIDLGDTRYGGQLDVGSGVLTVDKASVDLGTLTWSASSVGYIAGISGIKRYPTAQVSSLICDRYQTVSQDDITQPSTQFGISTLNWADGVFIKDVTVADAEELKTKLNGVQLVYELEEPQTIQLTPTQVWAVQGGNVITVSVDGVTAEIHTSNYATLKDIEILYNMIKGG